MLKLYQNQFSNALELSRQQKKLPQISNFDDYLKQFMGGSPGQKGIRADRSLKDDLFSKKVSNLNYLMGGSPDSPAERRDRVSMLNSDSTLAPLLQK